MSLLRQNEIDAPSGQRGRCSHSFLSFFEHISRKEDRAACMSQLYVKATPILHILLNLSDLGERFLFPHPPENAGEERHSVDEGVSRFYPFCVKEASDRPSFVRAKYGPSETQYMYM